MTLNTTAKVGLLKGGFSNRLLCLVDQSYMNRFNILMVCGINEINFSMMRFIDSLFYQGKNIINVTINEFYIPKFLRIGGW